MLGKSFLYSDIFIRTKFWDFKRVKICQNSTNCQRPLWQNQEQSNRNAAPRQITNFAHTKNFHTEKNFTTKNFRDKNCHTQKKSHDKKFAISKNSDDKKFSYPNISWQNIFISKNLMTKNFYTGTRKISSQTLLRPNNFMTKDFNTQNISWQNFSYPKKFHDKNFRYQKSHNKKHFIPTKNFHTQ